MVERQEPSPQAFDWVDTWKKQEYAKEVEQLRVINNINFTIKSPGGNYDGRGQMSTIKVTNGGVTDYWWGYSQQVNMKGYMTPGNKLVQFLQTRGQDPNNENGFLNFWCTADQEEQYAAPKLNPVYRDCGQNDLTDTMQATEGGNSADLKGNANTYSGPTACPNYYGPK